MSNIFAKPTTIPYFDNLKSPAFKSVATVVERVQKHMGTRYIQSSFNKDMLALGYARPSQKDMDRFLAGCEAGLIELTNRGEFEEKPEAEEAAQYQGAAVESMDIDGDHASNSALRLGIPAASVDPLETETTQHFASPFAALTGILMAEVMAELQRDLEAQACRLVADRLRQMADGFEQGISA